MILREVSVTILLLLSVISGSAATATAWIEGRPPEVPAVVAQVTPEAFTAWITAVANAIPVLAAALMLAWGTFRSKKREVAAADAAALKNQLAAKSGEVEALKASNAMLATRLDDAELAAKRSGPASFPVDITPGALPRWEPQVHLDDRDFDDDGDQNNDIPAEEPADGDPGRPRSASG